jgi:hypothetical protein
MAFSFLIFCMHGQMPKLTDVGFHAFACCSLVCTAVLDTAMPNTYGEQQRSASSSLFGLCLYPPVQILPCVSCLALSPCCFSWCTSHMLHCMYSSTYGETGAAIRF